MKKVTIPKKVQNELLKIMAARQVKGKKLNAGELRKYQDYTLEAIFQLSPASLLAFYATVEKLLVQKTKNETL